MRPPRPAPAQPTVLLVDGRPVAAAQVPATRRARTIGLLGTAGTDHALVLAPCRSVHTFGMRFAIDVAICDPTGRVLAVLHLEPGRVTRPRGRGTWIVEASAGAFQQWDLRVGSTLAVSAAIPPAQRRARWMPPSNRAQVGSPGSST